MTRQTRCWSLTLPLTLCCMALLATVSPVVAGGRSGAAPRPGDFQRPEAAPNRYFIAFREQVTPGDIAAVKGRGAAIHAAFPEARALAIQVKNPQQLAALEKNPRVEYIEAEPMRYAASLSSAQLTPSMSNGLYGLITTHATDVHQDPALPFSGAGIRVGVADTGIDYLHPDIQGRYKGGIDTVGAGDSDPFCDDGETHGTHVAGTIVGAYNTLGIYGVAYSADLYHARVLGPNGGTTSDIMEGVRWLVETAKCRVINLSLGGAFSSRTEENFYKSMRAKNVLIVAAAGNDGRTRLSYPAGYATNIAVGAVDRTNVRASFSNTGKNLDVVAPGVLVLSSVPRGQGSEASVVAGSTSNAYGMEFAGTTAGLTGALADCGLGKAGEFPAAVAGNIALIRRGDISFAEKVTNAMTAGAVAAIIYNNVAGDFVGTLGSAGNWIPAVSVSDATGATLKGQIGSDTTVVNQASDWDHYDGTSMATPHVTGVLALIWSAKSTLTNTAVENILYSTCTDLGAAGYDTIYGRGLVNAQAAVAQALK